jgi:hypothetical protein
MYERDRVMEYTKMLAENIVNTTYEDLPQKVIEKTKRHILDILGVMLPPSRFEKGCKILEEIAREGGGREESTLIGFGGKVPSWMAAFVNGSLCHPMDYDDTIDEFPNHPSSHAFPAAFAIAEKVGNVTGKEFLTAVALAVDLTVRLSAAPTGRVGEDYPWFSVPIFGGGREIVRPHCRRNDQCFWYMRRQGLRNYRVIEFAGLRDEGNQGRLWKQRRGPCRPHGQKGIHRL